MRSIAERVAGLSEAAPSTPPTVALTAAVSRCEQRLADVSALVAVGRLPERTYHDLRRQVDSQALAALAQLGSSEKELDAVLASVGLDAVSPWGGE